MIANYIFHAHFCFLMGYLSETGMVVLELSLVSGSAEDRKSCKAHPNFCLLLDPKLVGHFEMRWAPGRAATAYTVEGAVKPGEWVVLAQAEGPLLHKNNHA